VTAAPRLAALTLRSLLQPLCAAHRIDLCGVVDLPRRLPHTADWLNWLLKGHHADLEYLLRDPHGRADPNRVRPWARSLLVFAQRYANGWSPDDAEARGGCAEGRPWTAGVSRYARGRDYHDVLRGSIRSIVQSLRTELHARGVLAAESDLQSTDAVDAGPYLEREYAWLAGLGFYGKNTLLIHPKLGSGLFLGVALTSLEITGVADAPRPLVGPAAQRLPQDGMTSLCGKCTRCLDACPTEAFRDAWELDAGACLSTWSIEWRGGAPERRRAEQGGLLFGCDVCQAVCPWNHKAARKLLDPPPPDYAELPEHAVLDLADLIALDADAFRARFRRTPLWRAHPEGVRRNALIVAANTGRRDLLPAARRAAEQDPNPEVRAVAAWAVARLEGGSP